MDGWSAKVSCQAICPLELMTQRLRDRKPLYCPWWLSTEQAPSVRGTETFRVCSQPQRHSDTNQPNWLVIGLDQGRYKSLKVFTAKHNNSLFLCVKLHPRNIGKVFFCTNTKTYIISYSFTDLTYSNILSHSKKNADKCSKLYTNRSLSQ